ncbi:hypothetical protein TNCV_2094781 [Trichonephila clavipes]|nr:hypothetical protein TNCV_2094781 [Trichonephila clavipes]
MEINYVSGLRTQYGGSIKRPVTLRLGIALGRESEGDICSGLRYVEKPNGPKNSSFTISRIVAMPPPGDAAAYQLLPRFINCQHFAMFPLNRRYKCREDTLKRRILDKRLNPDEIPNLLQELSENVSVLI